MITLWARSYKLSLDKKGEKTSGNGTYANKGGSSGTSKGRCWWSDASRRCEAGIASRPSSKREVGAIQAGCVKVVDNNGPVPKE